MTWQNVLPGTAGVWLFRDSCNVYAVQGPAGMLIIDAGTGRWLDHLGDLPAPPAALALTHYFRDHSAGAAEAARRGIPVYVPEGERSIYTDPEQHFRQRENYVIYDNVWDLFAPIAPTAVTGVLRDYDKPKLAGIEVEIVPLPGVAIQQSGLEIKLADGKRLIFCGETIHSPGKIARVAPLQYNYHDLTGIGNVYYSTTRLRERKPDALLPSLGTPMIKDTDAALALLQENLDFHARGRAEWKPKHDLLKSEPLRKVTEHVWQDLHSVSTSWYVISRSGKVLALDYGYDVRGVAAPSYSKPMHRRALLHGVDALKKQFGIDRIDTVLVSHFHDDHVCGIPVLQRLHGTRCWAAESFADLLEKPEAHCFPCNWPTACRVDRRLPLNQPFQWEEYTFELHPMSGHTRFAALIGFEADGKRFAHTGDQYFFVDGWGPSMARLERFDNNKRFENHVYRNGALLDGYDQSRDWMLRWRPDIVLQGHQAPFFTDAVFFKHIEDWATDYTENHRRLMPLDDNEAHFNLDSWGGWIWPYRTHLPAPRAASVRITLRNPLPRRAKLEARLVAPPGWRGTCATVDAEPRAEVSCDLSITPSGPCRRQPFAVELVADGQTYGQVAEALMTVGGEDF